MGEELMQLKFSKTKHKEILKLYNDLETYVNRELYLFLSLAKLTMGMKKYLPVKFFIISPKGKGKSYLLEQLDDNYPTVDIACTSTSIGILKKFLSVYDEEIILTDVTYTLEDGTGIFNRSETFFSGIVAFLTPLLSNGKFDYSTFNVTKSMQDKIKAINMEYDGKVLIQFNIAVANDTLFRNEHNRRVVDILRQGTFLDRFLVVSFTFDLEQSAAIAIKSMHREVKDNSIPLVFPRLSVKCDPDLVSIPAKLDNFIVESTFLIAADTGQEPIRINDYLTTLMRVVAAIDNRANVCKPDVELVITLAKKYCNFDCKNVSIHDRILYIFEREQVTDIIKLRLKLKEKYNVMYDPYRLKTILESMNYCVQGSEIKKVDNTPVISSVSKCDVTGPQTTFEISKKVVE